MTKNILNIFFITLLLWAFAMACNKKSFICPAYNSYFIHDQTEREARFSPFLVDSLSAFSMEDDEDASVSKKSKSTLNTMADDGSGAKDELPTGNSKYQPKSKSAKKAQPNGLLIAAAKKNKFRAIDEIEMKFVMVKPLARYSNIDSSSIQQPPTQEQEVKTDSL